MDARQTRPPAASADGELERFGALVRQAPYFIGVFDPGLTPVFLNDAGRRMVGLAPDADVSTIPIPDFFHSDDRPRIRDIALPTMLRDGRWEGECRFRHFAGGDSYPVRWRAFAIRGERGEPIGGPDVPLRRDAVQIVALAVHELATNAQKYGALAHDGGHLSVHWSVRRDGERLALEWIENGVAPPPRAEPSDKERGFGRYLIEKALPFTLGAETSYELGANGLRCTIDIPLC